MTLRDQLAPSEHEGQDKDLRETAEDKITLYLGEGKSLVEVAAHHDHVFKFMRNMIDIFTDVAEQCEFDMWEKVCLLNDWLDSISTTKDKWFEQFKEQTWYEDDDDDE